MSAIRMPDHTVSGDGDTTIYLLHGAYGAKEYWRDELAVLCANGYRVVAWDAPGYGISPIPKPLTIEHCAAALDALIARTGTQRNIVLGHSMGGMVAQYATVNYPDRIHGLVLSATVSSVLDNDAQWQAEFFRRRVQPIVQGNSVAEYAPPLLREMMGPGAAGPTVDLVLEVVKAMRTETFVAGIEAIRAYDGREMPARIRVPTLLIAGELDGTCRAFVMERIAKAIPDSQYYCMKGVGHYGWAERADEYNGYLLDFLSRRFPR